MSLSLYQKYRPKNFASVVGQKMIVTSLVNSIKSDRISHAYIFAGPRGVGKTSIARLYAKALNCQSFVKDICNKCEHCKIFNASQPIDIIELDAASNNGVEEIRGLISTADYVPTQLSHKVYILDEAHMLTTSAWNALLKTLEECPDHNVFILATTEFRKIPLTVLSRCQLYSFQRITKNELEDLVKKIAKSENFQIDDASCQKLADLADGSARDVLTMLEQCLAITTNITAKDIQQIFYLADKNIEMDLFSAIKLNDVGKITKILNSLDENGINFSQFILDLLNMLIDCYTYNQTQNAKLLQHLKIDDVQAINLTNEQIWMMIDTLMKLQQQIKNNLDAYFFTRLILLEISKKMIAVPNVQIVQNDTLKVETETNVTVATEQKNLLNKSENTKEKSIADNKITLAESEYENIFINLASNNNKELIAKDTKIINEFKQMHWTDIDPILNALQTIEKIVISSENGIVVITKEEHEAMVINNFCFNNEYVNAITKLFNRPLYVIACTRKQLRLLTEKFKIARTNHNIPEIDMDKIKILIKNSMSRYDLVKKYFDDELEINKK